MGWKRCITFRQSWYTANLTFTWQFKHSLLHPKRNSMSINWVCLI